MDTESMIENAVAGIKLKISSLNKKRTKVEWQQDAYRSIIDKMANFTQKYTSYASSTNLLSSSFFNNAVKTTTSGTYADKVTASGKTSSDVQLLGVKQLAKAAVYRVSGSVLGGTDLASSIAGAEMDLAETQKSSLVSGSITLSYGGAKEFDLDFGDTDLYESVEDLAQGIRDKMAEMNYTTNSGETKKLSEVIGVEVKDGNIQFSDKLNAGNSVTIGSASGKIKDTLGIDTSEKSDTLTVGDKKLVDESESRGEYLSGKTMKVTLNGVSKEITLPEYTKDMTGKQFLQGVQDSLDKAFGKGKITVGGIGDSDPDTGSKFSLKLSAAEGSTLSVTSGQAEALGLPKIGASNYINTGRTLSDLLGEDFDWSQIPMIEAEGEVREVKTEDETYYVDSKGNRVAKSYDGENGKYYQVDKDGNYLHDFTVNGVSVGKFSKETALESVMTAINSSADAGVKVSYSKTTNEFQFTASENGAAGKIEFGDGLAAKLFSGGDLTEGQDAILSMEVNGKKFENISRSGNSFEVDGMTINLKGTFNYEGDNLKADAEAVTFTSSSDADKIVDAIKSMVEDYNAMVTEIKEAYSTQPSLKSDKSRYEPLTEDDKADMSESAIKAYEEKAKQGILFADSNLSSLYSKLRSAISPAGTDGADLRSIGISTSYSNGLTTISLDEKALRNALESDPDKVKNAFTKSKDSGSSSDGLMKSLLSPLETYGKTTGEPKGILVTRAGSIKAPTTLNSNSLKSQMDNIDKQIERWQNKMSDQIDRYTVKFSRLEQLIAEMNSQSSAMMGLMGGGSSY
ncbi:flagellar hook protein [Pseudoflavonifractor sp. 524-17]|nr:flagellar filament capping protein FliD [Pseudoflavonifractor sp. 524-17]NCE65522.1 flagellar hook protein [Pseudoflavonifractor sp. 524-17]